MTALTVPTAGTSPGRAARATQVQPSGVGQALGDFGDVMMQIGTATENDRLDREFQRHQVDLTRDINNLRLDIEAIGDPDAAEAAWSNGVSQLSQAYSGQREDGRPVVDPKNAERFGLAFDQLKHQTAFSIGRRNLGLRQAQREATFIDYQFEASRAAAGADPQAVSTLVAQGDQQIDQLVAAGVIDAATAAKRKQDLRGEISNARAIKMIAEDPDAFLAEAAGGGFPGLEADTVARYSVSAQASIDKRATDAIKAAEKAAADQQKAIGARLDEMADIYAAGRQPVDERLLSDPQVQAHPAYAETMAAASLRNESIDLATMSVAQINALIAGEKSRPVAHKYETERLTVLEKWRDRHAEGYAKDPIAHRAEVAPADVAPWVPYDPAAPDDFRDMLAARVRDGEALVAQGLTTSPRYLTNDERQELRQLASVENDPAARADLAQTLASLPRGSADTLAGVVEDPVFTHMGGFMAAGGSRKLAENVLRGQQVLAEKNVILPPAADRTDAAFASVEAYFADLPGGEKIQRAVLSSADALYAANIRTSDPAGDIDEDLYQQAVHEVMGGVGQHDSSEATGGLQDYRGALTPLPPGVSVKAVDQALLTLRQDLAGSETAVYPKAERAALDFAMHTGAVLEPITRMEPAAAKARGDALLQAMSLSGGQPGIGGEVLDWDTLGEVTLRAVGPDTYQFMLDGKVIPDMTTGGAYSFSLKRLMRGM